MIVYLDSSVILRFVLEQEGRLLGADDAEAHVTSLITLVECLRAVDNVRLRAGIGEDEYTARRAAVHEKLRGVTRLPPVASILLRAGDALPLPLKVLDAIHLATALQWRQRRASDLVFATHDRQLGRAASALGFPVIGV